MLKPNTVLIVGAGASAEVGLPTGTELAEQIAGLISIERDELSGRLPDHKPFVRALMNFAGPANLPEYLQAASRIRRGIRSAQSIDRYIDREAGDEFVRILGKAAIIEAIAFKERKSKLAADKGIAIGNPAIEATWYWNFVTMLLEGSPPLDKLFDGIAVISFNYDRTIEHYLTCELMRAYSIERTEAASLVKKLTIWHPYGTIAPLDTQEYDGVSFGDNEAISGRYFHLAPRIMTFTEDHKNSAMLSAIRRRIREAEVIVFLGFGYYKQNLQLIEPDGATRVKWIVGTGFGLSDSDRRVVEDRLVHWDKGDRPNIEVAQMTCAELLKNYRMALTA